MNIYSKHKHYKFIYHLANLLDNKFDILGIKFGISAVIDLIPGLGDIIDALLSLYIVWVAIQLNVPIFRIIQMIINIIINVILGAVPVVGDAVYILRRVNLKNLEIIKQYVPFDVIEGKAV